MDWYKLTKAGISLLFVGIIVYAFIVAIITAPK
jgi:hypothetical protein